MKNFREMESKLFGNGCYIDYEVITNGKQIRGITTIDNKKYKLIYVKNKNNVFVINNIMEV